MPRIDEKMSERDVTEITHHLHKYPFSSWKDGYENLCGANGKDDYSMAFRSCDATCLKCLLIAGPVYAAANHLGDIMRLVAKRAGLDALPSTWDKWLDRQKWGG